MILDSGSVSERRLIEEGRHEGRPYRKYSDGTFKAATSSGWIEYSDFEALANYHRSTKLKREVERSKGGFVQKLRGLIS